MPRMKLLKLAVCLALLAWSAWSRESQAQNRPPRLIIDRIPSYDKSSETASKRAWRESSTVENQKSTKKTEEVIVSVSNYQELNKKLDDEIEKFLLAYKLNYPVAYEKYGIKYVKPEYLDKGLLKLARGKARADGVVNFHIIYDASFHRHVRKRGRQLKLREEGRFLATIYVFAGVFAALFLLYGTLKVLNARASKHDDYISAGRISMV